MRSPQIQGEEWPGGSSVVQIASALLMAIGGLADAETPWPEGPRNWGQKGCECTDSASNNRPSVVTNTLDARPQAEMGIRHEFIIPMKSNRAVERLAIGLSP